MNLILRKPQICNYSSLILGNLKPAKGSIGHLKRVGRGPSSNMGKTSTRGQKGQKARSSVKPWFEGGQTPIYKLFPKRFNVNDKKQQPYQLDLSKIQSYYKKNKEKFNEIVAKNDNVLDIKTMKKLHIIDGTHIKNGVNILSRNPVAYKLPIKIEASRATPDAIEAIEKNKGEFVARYFTKLGMRAHVSPHVFLEKYGRVPLQARPIKRKDIEFYSNKENRGYLYQDSKDTASSKVNAAAAYRSVTKIRRKSKLEKQLDDLLQNKDTTQDEAIRKIGSNSKISYIK